jgi:hypothetical protein
MAERRSEIRVDPQHLLELFAPSSAAAAGRYSAKNGGAGSAMKQNPILAPRAE